MPVAFSDSLIPIANKSWVLFEKLKKKLSF